MRNINDVLIGLTNAIDNYRVKQEEIQQEINLLTNAVEGIKTIICSDCRGSGEQRILDEAGSPYHITCTKCHGSGVYINCLYKGD